MTEQPDLVARPRRRSGGRAAHVDRAKGAIVAQSPWRPPQNMDRPTEPLDQGGVAAIHETAMRILEEIGVAFLNDEAVAILRSAGCRQVDGKIRMGRDFVMEMVAKAPSQFDLTPRNPARRVVIGDGTINFVNVSSPPNYWDLTIGKVPGTRAQCRDLLRLTQFFNCVHIAGGYPVEPLDSHPRVRHLDVLSDKLTLTDKVVHAYSLGPQRVEDVMEMVRIAGGLTAGEFEASPRMYTNINSTSPLKHDWPMIDGLMRCVRRGQAVIVTPFTLAGAMAPVTMAGAVAQSVAEALCAIALAQWLRPGAPCVFGTFTSNVDMRSGAPAFGTPEYVRATQVAGQMARYYGLPLRSSGACTSSVPDPQAMWETCNSLWAALQSGSHIVYHAAGWLEGGLVASPEKFVMDCEVLQQLERYCDPVVVGTGEEELAFGAIAEVAGEGHYFGIEHTRERYQTAFYRPFLSELRSHEAWREDGSVSTLERAHRIFREIVTSFEPPPMDAAIRDELAEFVDRRKREGGAPTDY